MGWHGISGTGQEAIDRKMKANYKVAIYNTCLYSKESWYMVMKRKPFEYEPDFKDDPNIELPSEIWDERPVLMSTYHEAGWIKSGILFEKDQGIIYEASQAWYESARQYFIKYCLGWIKNY